MSGVSSGTSREVSMFRTLLRATGIVLAVGSLALLSAAGSAIGMAVANGSFQVDHAAVYGNGTLFDGSVVETWSAASDLRLNGGGEMRLAGESRAKVYQHRLVLEQGLGEMTAASSFEVDARSLHILGDSGSVARIQVESGTRVLVSAVHGGLRVTNAGGVLVANMAAGNNMVFEPQAAGEAAPTHVSGCLLEKGGKFILAEKTTNIVLELQGSELAKQVGNRVEVTGKADTAPGAGQVVQVADLKMVSKGGCSSIAKKLGAATVAAGGGAAGGGAGTRGSGAGAGTAAAGATGAATAGAGSGGGAIG